MKQNKMGKYFKYAIGEIILVVIGILIALQINNWNENQKIIKSEASILTDLKKEFEDNINDVNNSIQFNLDNTQASISIDSIIKSNELSSNLNQLDSLFIKLGEISSFKPNRGITDQIINSGKLEILTNNELKLLITQWTSELEKSNTDIKYEVDNYTNNLMPFLMEYFPLSNGDLIKDQFPSIIPVYKYKSKLTKNVSQVNLLKFENMIWHHKHNLDYLIRRDLTLKTLIEHIIDEIDISLNNVNGND